MTAQFNLARMYKMDGNDKDYNKASEYLNNWPISMLAYCYYNRIGTKVDNQKAADFVLV